MTRIIYGIYSSGGLQGGHKMILRHVETLRELGFDAYAYTGEKNVIPDWFEHRAPVLTGDAVRPHLDVFVLPDDGVDAIPLLAKRFARPVVMVQNHFTHLAISYRPLLAFPADRRPPFLAVSPTVQRLLDRLHPGATTYMIRAFADERLFQPAKARAAAIAMVPRKRPMEARAIRNLFAHRHAGHADFAWRELDNMTEAEVAQGYSDAALAVSLSAFEGLGMTTLEAMACGCLVAGFTGIGGADYATQDNGFWVPEDDVEACADALAEAAGLFRAGGAALRRRQEAAIETARAWSHAVFRRELEAAWTELAPEARR